MIENATAGHRRACARARGFRRVLGVGLVVGAGSWALLALGGCGASGQRAEATDDAEPVNAGLDALASEDAEMRRRLEEDADEVARMYGEGDWGRVERAPAVIDDGPAPRANLEPSVGLEDVEVAEAAPVTGRGPMEPPPTLEQRVARLAAELAARLRDMSDQDASPVQAMAALGGLELVLPGISEGHTPTSGLTPRERDVLGVWTEMMREAYSGLRNAQEPGSLARAVVRAGDQMGVFEPFTIRHAALCSRVEGFGRFTEMPGRAMLAGRRHAAIVYVEVDRFAHKAATGPDGESGWQVELSQDLSLYHESDGLLAWRRPEQEIVDFSRNRRRDFFVVQRIELPETLTVGSYRLKVTMRDKGAPGGGAVAERIIPIDIVADPDLVRTRGR